MMEPCSRIRQPEEDIQAFAMRTTAKMIRGDREILLKQQFVKVKETVMTTDSTTLRRQWQLHLDILRQDLLEPG